MLCDASGQPKLDSHGNQITTVTDANGYYEFTNLYPDVYSIMEKTQPANYLPGIDTVGTKNGVADGLVFNSYTYKSLDAGTLSMLSALNSSSIAIAKITLDAGDEGGFVQLQPRVGANAVASHAAESCRRLAAHRADAAAWRRPWHGPLPHSSRRHIPTS